MEAFFATLYTFGIGVIHAVTQSTAFLVFKIFAAIYTAVLVVDVVLLIYLDDPRKRYRQLRRGTGRVPAGTHKLKKKWDVIRGRLDEDNEDAWKLAILEADHLIDRELAEQGYHGDNFAERLAQVPARALPSVERVREVHALRNRIVRDETYEVSHEQATEAVTALEQFLEDLGIENV